jgi:hypothetical protein
MRFPTAVAALLAAAAALSSGCGAVSGDEITMFIGPEKRPCTTFFPTECLQQAPTAQGPWGHFYSGIDGFTWERGFLYELRVRVVDWPDHPVDGPDRRHILVRIVSKTRAP